jgi:hypothetical protein
MSKTKNKPSKQPINLALREKQNPINFLPKLTSHWGLSWEPQAQTQQANQETH